MLDLAPIQAKLAAISPWPWQVRIASVDNPIAEGIFSADETLLFRPFACRHPDLELLKSIPTDLDALISEVMDLRYALAILVDAHRDPSCKDELQEALEAATEILGNSDA
jgi:hypothetical protein